MISQALLENGTYEQVVSHIGKEIEPNYLEASDEMQICTVTQQVIKPISEKSKRTCHHCKKRGYHRNQCRQLKKKETKMAATKNSAGNNINVNKNSG